MAMSLAMNIADTSVRWLAVDAVDERLGRLGSRNESSPMYAGLM